MKKISIVIGVVLVTALIGFKLVKNKQSINESNKPIDRSLVKVPVTIEKVKTEIFDGSFTLPAVVKPTSEINIVLNSAGKIKSLNFNLGSRVGKGQVIGSIDNNLKQINLQSAELLAEKTRIDFERYSDLYSSKAATEVDFNNAKYNYENAKNQVAQIKQQIADGNIVSPINGIITKINIEEGEYVGIGQAVASIVDVSELKSSVMVSEKDVYRLKEGMPVKIISDVFPDKSFKGTVRFISPHGDESHNYEVEINFRNDDKLALKAGTFIKVKFDLKTNYSAIQIPKLALIEGTKNPTVYVAEGNKAIVKNIVLGRDLGENIEVLSGLNIDELVITSGQINLTEKSIIEVITVSNKN